MILNFFDKTFFSMGTKNARQDPDPDRFVTKNFEIRKTGGPIKGKMLNGNTEESLKGNPPQE